MSADSSTRRKGLFTCAANVLLAGLAAGALWCLLSLTTDSDTSYLIVPLALVIGVFMRWQGYRGRVGAISAVTATLIAFVYAQYLFAAVNMAGMLGFPLRDTLFKMDLPLAWQIVRAHASIFDIVFLAVACAGSAWAAAWRRRRATPS